eukprot:317332_1
MVQITKELLKKRAEHNDGILSSLEEITLHQYNIEKIELVQNHCKHLKILYLQNNLIEKIENLYKLKQLQYLNLALNNITKIEGLHTCESLTKLDLTLNFIDIPHFEESISNLKQNIFLSELHLTGNPCTDFKDYRLFVIYWLPHLRKLDSIEVKKSEIIKAKQSYPSIVQRLRAQVTERANNNGNDTTNSDRNIEYDHSVEGRKAAYYNDKERERKDEEENAKRKANNPFVKPTDVVKETRQKMCVVEKEGENGELPKQRNIGRYEFKMEGIDDMYAQNIRVVIEAPKYLDTSEMLVDVHPLWFQVIIKNKSLLLHLPMEIKVNECRVRRIMCNGWLELILPKLTYKKMRQKKKSTEISQTKMKLSQDTDDHDCKENETKEKVDRDIPNKDEVITRHG